MCLDPADGALSRMAAPSGDSILERLGPSRILAPDSLRRPSHLAISSWREGGYFQESGAIFLEKAEAHRVDHTRRLLLRLASTDLLSVILRDDTLIHSADFSGGSYTACLVQTQIVKLVKRKSCEAKCIHCKNDQHANTVFDIISYRPLMSKNDFNKRR